MRFRRFRGQSTQETAGCDGQIAGQSAGDWLTIPNQLRADHAVGAGEPQLNGRMGKVKWACRHEPCSVAFTLRLDLNCHRAQPIGGLRVHDGDRVVVSLSNWRPLSYAPAM